MSEQNTEPSRIAQKDDELIQVPAAVDDKIEVKLGNSAMEALARVELGTPDGARVTWDAAMSALRQARVVYGIDDAAVMSLISRPVGEWLRVAGGTEPVDGTDASLNYLFRTKVTKAAKVYENDRVDFWELDLFEPCRAGQTLVEKTSATQGEPGKDVTGDPVLQRPGRDIPLPRGKNVDISKDGLKLIAKFDGHVTVAGDQIVVQDTFEIAHDVDMSTGNINYAGNVIVRGRVSSGMVIKAGANIEVTGLVESAVLEAGGDITLHRGVLASEGGRISAKGCVSARYLERANVMADGYVTADAIMHSAVESGRYILADGSRGAIIGGRCAASEFIAAKSVGAAAGVLTSLELGMSPNRRARLVFVRNEVNRLSAEIDKLKHLLRLIGSVNVPGEPEVRALSRQKAAMTLREDVIALPKLVKERENLLAEQEAANNGRAHISGAAYQGVRVVIGSSMFQVTTQMEYATFRMDEETGRVICVPHEFSGIKESRRPKR